MRPIDGEMLTYSFLSLSQFLSSQMSFSKNSTEQHYGNGCLHRSLSTIKCVKLLHYAQYTIWDVVVLIVPSEQWAVKNLLPSLGIYFWIFTEFAENSISIKKRFKYKTIVTLNNQINVYLMWGLKIS